MTDPASTSPALPRTWPLVGRAEELDRIGSVISGRHASGVVLVGEAGVGKTRLAEEALTRAELAGFTIGRVFASRAAASVPLGALAPLLPRPPSAADIQHDALHDSVEALATRAGDGRFLLAVDDAQWLDSGSAVVLQQLIRTSDAMLVITQRSDEPAPDAVASLWKDGLADRIEVGPLTRPGTEALLGQVLGGPVDGATLADLWWSSQGNPLFLRELVVGAVEAGFLTDEAGVWRMQAQLVTSPRLVELVGARLTDLEPDERAALEVVAFGEPLPLGLLATLADEAVAESLERRGLVTLEAADGGRQIRLAHPLYGEVLRETTPALRAMAVQRRLAETVQRRGVRAEDELRVGVWILESEGEADPDLMTAASRRALFAEDPDLARRLARVAISAGAGVDAEQVLGEALYVQGHHTDAVEVLGAAVGRASSDRQRALIALAMAEALFNGLGRPGEAAAVLEGAAAAISEAGWHDEVLALRAVYRLLGGDIDEAMQAVEPLTAEAHPRAFVVAATVTAPALAIRGRSEESIEIADRAFAVHVGLGQQEILGSPGIHLVARALALAEGGRLEEAVATAAAGYEGAVAERALLGQAWFALIRARALWLTDLAQAMRWFRQGAAAFEQAGYGGQRRWCLAGAAAVTAQQGRGAEARELWEAIPELPCEHVGMLLSDIHRAEAWVWVAAGRLTEGLERLETAVETAREAGCPALEVSALHDFVRLGHADRAIPQIADAAEAVDGPLAATRAAHGAALQAGVAAELEKAAQSFADTGASVLAAEAFAQASALWKRGGERRFAQRAAHQAAELAAGSGGMATPALMLAGEASSLTRRELEIATLAAQGLTNREIADHLVVSVRTIGNHLQRAYSKLGVDGRDALGEALGLEIE